MSFGNNLIYYRKKYNITQEELAEKMQLTRQTVSRWETDNAFPEMDKLILLCDTFHCDMDTLLRGDAAKSDSQQDGVNLKAYDSHMNGFAASVTAGVFIVLIGLAAMLFINAFSGETALGTIVFLSCITVAVSLFVAGGISHANFLGDNALPGKYPDGEVKAFRRKTPFLIAGATALILIGVIFVVAANYRSGYAPSGFTTESWETFTAGILMVFIAFAAGIFVLTGMLMSKYNIKSLSDRLNAGSEEKTGGENAEENASSDIRKAKKGERIISACSSVIMLTCTIAFLIMGFLGGLWHPGWVVFPVGGILCGIVSVITEAICGKR